MVELKFITIDKLQVGNVYNLITEHSGVINPHKVNSKAVVTGKAVILQKVTKNQPRFNRVRDVYLFINLKTGRSLIRDSDYYGRYWVAQFIAW